LEMVVANLQHRTRLEYTKACLLLLEEEDGKRWQGEKHREWSMIMRD